jgi:hypothetical protein
VNQKPLNGPIRVVVATALAPIPAASKAVLIAILSYADWRSFGEVRASAASLAVRAGLGERATRSHLHRLEAIGVLVVTGAVRGGRSVSGLGQTPTRQINVLALEGLNHALNAVLSHAKPCTNRPSTLHRRGFKPAPRADNQHPTPRPTTTTLRKDQLHRKAAVGSFLSNGGIG